MNDILTPQGQVKPAYEVHGETPVMQKTLPQDQHYLEVSRAHRPYRLYISEQVTDSRDIMQEMLAHFKAHKMVYRLPKIKDSRIERYISNTYLDNTIVPGAMTIESYLVEELEDMAPGKLVLNHDMRAWKCSFLAQDKKLKLSGEKVRITLLGVDPSTGLLPHCAVTYDEKGTPSYHMLSWSVIMFVENDTARVEPGKTCTELEFEDKINRILHDIETDYQVVWNCAIPCETQQTHE